MKKLLILMLAGLAACNNNGVNTANKEEDTLTDTQQQAPDTTTTITDPVMPVDSVQAKTYANTRFREVRVEKLDSNKYRVTGQGQIFEARFGWVVEDGHNELAQGFEDTNAGAPAWGDFDFTVTAKKARPNSTLHLVLYETSAKDGSRVHELPIPLD